MIKLLKNKEVRKALLWQLLLSAAACAVCFFFDIRAGLTAAGLSLLLMLVFCISTYKRYQRISSLADDINQVLHGDSSIDFDSYSEGELSILHSEIYKMTIGVCISIIGIVNIMGNISAIHSYNRRKVKEEDVPKYGRAVGTGTLIIGVSLIAAFVTTFWSETAMSFIVIPALVIGLGFILYAQFKYNKGIF